MPRVVWCCSAAVQQQGGAVPVDVHAMPERLHTTQRVRWHAHFSTRANVRGGAGGVVVAGGFARAVPALHLNITYPNRCHGPDQAARRSALC